MPMKPEGAPDIARRIPEAAAIFDNLQMLHDNFDDILVRPDLYPTMAAKRAAILKVLPIYLHRTHGVNDRYPDFHEPAADGHGGGDGGAMRGPRPPSAADVLPGTAPPSNAPQPDRPAPQGGGHKH
jgi:hypothetical protein